MKVSHLSILIVMCVVIAVAVAGCTSTGSSNAGSTASPTSQGSAASTTTAAGAAQTAAAGSVVSGANIFGTAPDYSWLEYKTVTTAEGKTMTMYLKYAKSGTCTMRIEGEGMPSGGMTMDCSSSGSQTQSNPSEVKSDVQFTFVGIEPVTVPAGTYPTASKYTVTSNGQTVTYWTAPGVPGFVKMQYTSSDGSMATELNGWG
jgi:hypothetical protein